MPSPYKRRRPALLRNLWVYRYVIASAFLFGVILWFILINNTPVSVTFPFRMGIIQSTAGLLILLSAMAGALATGLLTGLGLAFRRWRGPGSRRADDPEGDAAIPQERPPTDYASRTTEGFSEAPWSGR